MYIESENKVLAKWENTEDNRVFATKYGLSIYTGEVEEVDGVLYAKGFAPVKSLEELQAEKTTEINTAFINEIEVSGTLVSSIDSFVIDARRVDVQNIQGLIDTYTEPTIFMGKDGIRPNTNLSELNTFKQELIKKGQELYYKKWQKLEEIKNATLETIGGITW